MSNTIRENLMLALAGQWLVEQAPKKNAIANTYVEYGVTPEMVLEAARIVKEYSGSGYEADDGWNPTLNRKLEEAFGSKYVKDSKDWTVVNWQFVGEYFLDWLFQR